jgi:hypothetical protein
MKSEIQIDDTVRVDFHGAQFTLCVRAKVIHIPQASGDSWQFMDLNTGMIHFVSEGCTVSRRIEPRFGEKIASSLSDKGEG